jgi:hypothetical protein
VEELSKWTAADAAWPRLLSSASLNAIARHSAHARQWDQALVALEESLALQLFPYSDPAALTYWQTGLVMPGSVLHRQKLELASALVLRCDCLLQLAQVRMVVRSRETQHSTAQHQRPSRQALLTLVPSSCYQIVSCYQNESEPPTLLCDACLGHPSAIDA